MTHEYCTQNKSRTRSNVDLVHQKGRWMEIEVIDVIKIDVAAEEREYR